MEWIKFFKESLKKIDEVSDIYFSNNDKYLDLFRLCPPPHYVMRSPFTEHVSLHSKSLCKNIERESGGCK